MADHVTIRILVVDDDQSVRQALAEFLEDCDFVVTTAASAEEALATLAETPHDVAIVDLRLPGLRGDEFIERVAATTPEMHFLIYTGSSVFELTEGLARVGLRPEHVLHKPLPTLRILVEAIDKLISP